MHIPDAYLSPISQAAAYAVMVPLWTVAAKKTSKSLTSRQTPLLSVGAAFAFAIQMFNIPAIGGTTAHALGAGLLAILVGPWAALLGMSLTLAIQALLFGDGGILSLGANCFNMGFVACFVTFGAFRLLSSRSDIISFQFLASSGFAAFLGTVTASVSAGILLGAQPLLAHDALGHALYCPFGFSVTIPAMVMTHLAIAGPAEAIITLAALAYVGRSFPSLLTGARPTKIGQGLRLARRTGWVLALCPLGLLAAGSAFGEWDLGEIKNMVGYAPEGMSHAHEFILPLLPDYGFAGVEGKSWEVAGYLVSALIGFGVVFTFAWALFGRKKRAEPTAPNVRGTLGHELPFWLARTEIESPLFLERFRKSSPDLIGSVLLGVRGTLEETIVSERIARATGVLQSLPNGPKAVLFLCGLIAVSLAHAPILLMAMLIISVGLARMSAIPVPGFVRRVMGSVAFFGLPLALPMALKAVTPGPTALELGPLVLSAAGLTAAGMLLARLATSISLALLWILTSRSHQLVRSLDAIGASKDLQTSLLLTYRYLFVLMETLGDMVTARTSRQVGGADKKQVREYAGAGAAILFAKSLGLTEELHQAMLARGATLVRELPPSAPSATFYGVTDAI